MVKVIERQDGDKNCPAAMFTPRQPDVSLGRERVFKPRQEAMLALIWRFWFASKWRLPKGLQYNRASDENTLHVNVIISVHLVPKGPFGQTIKDPQLDVQEINGVQEMRSQERSLH